MLRQLIQRLLSPVDAAVFTVGKVSEWDGICTPSLTLTFGYKAMTCPACQNEMATGHLFCGGASIDGVREEQPGWKKFLTIGNQHLTDFQGKLPGFHYEHCGFLIVPHDELRPPQ